MISCQDKHTNCLNILLLRILVSKTMGGISGYKVAGLPSVGRCWLRLSSYLTGVEFKWQ